MVDADLPALRNILNHITSMGGTTAHLTPMSGVEFKAHYFDDPPFVQTVLDANRPVGFQALFTEDDDGLRLAASLIRKIRSEARDM
ncbi:hypothetical protein [Yoonia sp.]|uniref:hypothetical protein n=1 Tax=Yoonia sp. TaxID=2212373 RepID=UPI00238D8E3A|nr:hypothetical protein [Yoonia sp.]MDE0850517.1 hypothetical protein [Yoonia sp.]